MKNVALVVACLGAGIVGGWISNHLDVSVFPMSEAQATKVVSAQTFNLVDDKGRVRGQIAMSREGTPGLFFMDQQGRARLTTGLYPDGTGHFVLNDSKGNATQVIRSFGSNESPLMIFKNSGQDQMILGLNPVSGQTTPFLMYYNQEHKKTVQFGKYDGP